MKKNHYQFDEVINSQNLDLYQYPEILDLIKKDLELCQILFNKFNYTDQDDILCNALSKGKLHDYMIFDLDKLPKFRKEIIKTKLKIHKENFEKLTDSEKAIYLSNFNEFSFWSYNILFKDLPDHIRNYMIQDDLSNYYYLLDKDDIEKNVINILEKGKYFNLDKIPDKCTLNEMPLLKKVILEKGNYMTEKVFDQLTESEKEEVLINRYIWSYKTGDLITFWDWIKDLSGYERLYNVIKKHLFYIRAEELLKFGKEKLEELMKLYIEKDLDEAKRFYGNNLVTRKYFQ